MAFNIPNQTSYVKRRPVSIEPWVRPADWITITDATGEVQFLVNDTGLASFRIATTFTRTLGTQNIYIDWGDGVVDTISTLTTASFHTYTTGGTACSLGYNTWKVRVYGDTGTKITGCQTTQNPNIITSYPAQGTNGFPVGLLEAYYGDNTVESFPSYFSGERTIGQGYFSQLQYVKLPATILGTSLNNTFYFCTALAKVVMPTSAPNITNCVQAFGAARVLQSVIFPQDATKITTMASAFLACNSLYEVVLPSSLNACTTMNQTFAGCPSLKNVIIPPLAICTDYTSAFSGCRDLITIEFPGFTSGATTVTTTSMFATCNSLEYVKMPTTVAAGTLFACTSMFGSCVGLKSFIFPTNFDCASLQGTFQGCASLSTCIMPTSMPSLTTMASTFSNTQLQEITLPATVGASIALVSTFDTCPVISSITIPSGWTITTLQSTFNNAFGLRSIVLPNNAQNSITTMGSMCNGCTSLESIVMPTSLNACTSLGNTFVNCTPLKSIIFPTTMNACTTMASTFNCLDTRGRLSDITLPTSMTACTAFNSTFAGQTTISSITFPSTTGNITTFTACFQGAGNIRTVVFPTTQLTALSSLSNIFDGCGYITTLTNVDKLGNPSTTATTYVAATTFTSAQYTALPSVDFYCKFSRLDLAGATGAATVRAQLASLRLRNNGAGQYAGTSPQINIANTNLSQAALVQVFNDLPTITAKTINITAATGAAALTAGERAIATGKGWTIIG